jgi:hypothetical protein
VWKEKRLQKLRPADMTGVSMLHGLQEAGGRKDRRNDEEKVNMD